MKVFFVCCMSLGLLLPGGAQRQSNSEICYDTARSQAELNECAGGAWVKADKELNRTYQQILKKYAKDILFLQRLKLAQRAWLAFRDAEIQMKFSNASVADVTAQYGSVYPMCYLRLKAELTERRNKELTVWLKGIEEGDVCSGSIKTPEELK
jgi:uncharacterized protein YecT (DUF1311 family)